MIYKESAIYFITSLISTTIIFVGRGWGGKAFQTVQAEVGGSNLARIESKKYANQRKMMLSALTSQAKLSLAGSRTHLPRKGPNLVPWGTGALVHTPPCRSSSWGGGLISWAATPPPSSRPRHTDSASPLPLHSDSDRLSSPANKRDH